MTDFINNSNLPDFRYPTPFMGRGEISCCYTCENGMYESLGEFGIKFLGHGAMAILYIPKGSLVHIDGHGPTECRKDDDKFRENAKCRTELALCVEIGKFSLSDDIKERVNKNGDLSFSTELVIEKLQIGESLFWKRSLFRSVHLKYRPMRLVYPDEPFDMQDGACTSGIHYYHHFVDFDRIFENGAYLSMGNAINAWMDHVASSRTIEEWEEIVAKEREKLIISNKDLLDYANGMTFTEEVKEK